MKHLQKIWSKITVSNFKHTSLVPPIRLMGPTKNITFLAILCARVLLSITFTPKNLSPFLLIIISVGESDKNLDKLNYVMLGSSVTATLLAVLYRSTNVRLLIDANSITVEQLDTRSVQQIRNAGAMWSAMREQFNAGSMKHKLGVMLSAMWPSSVRGRSHIT